MREGRDREGGRKGRKGKEIGRREQGVGKREESGRGGEGGKREVRKGERERIEKRYGVGIHTGSWSKYISPLVTFPVLH